MRVLTALQNNSPTMCNSISITVFAWVAFRLKRTCYKSFNHCRPVITVVFVMNVTRSVTIWHVRVTHFQMLDIHLKRYFPGNGEGCNMVFCNKSSSTSLFYFPCIISLYTASCCQLGCPPTSNSD